jgi:hypothetical protein
VTAGGRGGGGGGETGLVGRECTEADGMLDFLQTAVEDSCEGLMIKVIEREGSSEGGGGDRAVWLTRRIKG